MSSEKDPLAGLEVVEPGTGADAQASIFVGEAVGPGEEFSDLPQGNPSEAGLISQQQFYDTMFCGLFAAPQMLNPAFAPMAIQDSEKGMARPASDAVYELLLIYYPPILRPGGKTAGLFLMMLPFLMLKITTLRAIIKEGRTPPPTRNETNGEENQ